MILIDTSTWIAHFQGKDVLPAGLLSREEGLLHPFVLGELMLGGLPREAGLAIDFAALPSAPVASVAEVAAFIAWAELTGTGIGYVDTHLLVSARLAGGLLLTLDRRLRAQAERLGVAYAG